MNEINHTKQEHIASYAPFKLCISPNSSSLRSDSSKWSYSSNSILATFRGLILPIFAQNERRIKKSKRKKKHSTLLRTNTKRRATPAVQTAQSQSHSVVEWHARSTRKQHTAPCPVTCDSFTAAASVFQI